MSGAVTGLRSRISPESTCELRLPISLPEPAWPPFCHLNTPREYKGAPSLAAFPPSLSPLFSPLSRSCAARRQRLPALKSALPPCSVALHSRAPDHPPSLGPLRVRLAPPQPRRWPYRTAICRPISRLLHHNSTTQPPHAHECAEMARPWHTKPPNRVTPPHSARLTCRRCSGWAVRVKHRQKRVRS
jgi:hypothetical protein